MEGRRWASIDLPVPGGPISSRLWCPAAAISSARRASGCPRTSAKSGKGPPAEREKRVGGVGKSGVPPRRWSASSRTVCRAYTCSSSTTAASGALSAGTNSTLTP